MNTVERSGNIKEALIKSVIPQCMDALQKSIALSD